MPKKILPCNNLASRHTGLTVGIGRSYEEAAAVCLDRHHNNSPVEFLINVFSSTEYALAAFTTPTDREKNAWANETDATEQGACGLALAAVELFSGMLAIRRAETQTGADYYVASQTADRSDMESWFRLEISGTDRGDALTIRNRLQQKITQALNGKSNLPALAAVVGFLAKHIAIEKVEPL